MAEIWVQATNNVYRYDSVWRTDKVKFDDVGIPL